MDLQTQNQQIAELKYLTGKNYLKTKTFTIN